MRCDCSRSVTSTETDTGQITGWVVYKNKKAVRDADVILRDADMIQMVSIGQAKQRALTKKCSSAEMMPESTNTSPAGFFSFSEVDIGDYYIEINDHDSLGAVAEAAISDDKPVCSIDTIVLKQTGTIEGSIDKSLIKVDSTFVYIVEIDRRVSVDSLGRFLIENVPARDYTIRIMENSTVVESLLDTIEVSESDTVSVYNIGAEFGTIDIDGIIHEE